MLLRTALGSRPGLQRALEAAGAAFLFSRLVVYGAALMAPILLPEREYLDLAGTQLHTGATRLLDALVRWDGVQYLSAAQAGYRLGTSSWDTNAHLFPLYPWLMALMGGWAGEMGLVVAGVFLSNAAFFVALVLLYVLAVEVTGEEAARRSLLYLAVFPTAFFFSALYAESLFLALVLATLVGLGRGHWLAAGLAGAGAAMARPLGILLVAVFVWDYWRLRRTTSLLGAAMVLLGLLLVMAVQWLQLGSPVAFMEVQALWGRRLGSPLDQVILAFSALTRDGLRPPGFGLLFPVALILLFGWAGLRAGRVLPSTYLVWFWLYLLASLANPGQDPFYSAIRFLLGAFPAFIILGDAGQHLWFHRAYLALSVFFLALSTILFSQWYWVA